MCLPSYSVWIIVILLSCTPLSWSQYFFSPEVACPLFPVGCDPFEKTRNPSLFLKSLSDTRRYSLEASGWVPLTHHARHLVFAELQTQFSSNQMNLLGIGFGFKHGLENRRAFEGHLFWDQIYDAHNNFHILSASLVWITSNIKLQFNGYIPLTGLQCLGEIPSREALIRDSIVRFHHDLNHRVLYASYSLPKGQPSPTAELMLHKRLDQLKATRCYGGVYFSITQLGCLAGMDYQIHSTTRLLMRFGCDLMKATTTLEIGLQVTLGESDSKETAWWHAPVDRYLTPKLSGNLLPMEEHDPIPKQSVFFEKVYIPAEREFDQSYIDAAEPGALFYLPNKTQANTEIRYGKLDEPILLKSRQSIIGSDAFLRPLLPEINRASEFTVLESDLKLENTDSHMIQAIRLRGLLSLKNNRDIWITGLYIDEGKLFDSGDKMLIHIEQGSRIHLNHILLHVSTRGNNRPRTMTLKGLYGVYINEDSSVDISNFTLSMFSERNNTALDNTKAQYHGKLYGIEILNGSQLSIRNSQIKFEIADEISADLFNRNGHIGEISGIRHDSHPVLKKENVKFQLLIPKFVSTQGVTD